MGKLLTREQMDCFHDQGMAFPIPVLSDEEASEYRQACNRLEAQLGGKPRTIEVRQMHLHLPWAHRLATHPRVLDAAEDVLGPDLLVWATELFAKHPQDAAVTIGWHRDGPYMGLDPDQTVTAWIALTPCERQNGCMRFVREHDRRSAPSWETRAAHRQNNAPAENRVPDLADEELADVTLRPGEMSLHDVYVLHGSGPNLSRTKRIGFAIRFTTPRCRPAQGRPPAILARGHDRFGRFELQDAPQPTDEGLALARMKSSALAHFDATLKNLKESVH